MADKCGCNKCSSYFNGYSENINIEMNITKPIALTHIYIFSQGNYYLDAVNC